MQSVQQEFANLYGANARDMAAEPKLDITGMTGPDTISATTKAFAVTVERDGFEGDAKLPETVVALTAYQTSLESFGSDIIALAAISAIDPSVTAATSLISSVAKKAAKGGLARLKQPATIVA